MREKKTQFESVRILKKRWKDGTFLEILEDWRWILGYSARYKGAILFYVVLGILSTSFGLASSVASKYLIDIITGYQTSKLAVLFLVMVGGQVFSLLFESLINRVSTKLSIDINNDIQADIFDKIIDADWMEISKYSNGDILNRFNGDIHTVSSNAISWLPTIIIALYKLVATFMVILHYDWVMALIALGSAPFLLLLSRTVLKKQRDFSQKVLETSSKLMGFEVETFYNFDTIKSFGIAPHYSKKMRWWQKRFRDDSLKYNYFTIKTNVVLQGIGMVVQFIAFGYCLFRLWTHDITYGTMTLFLQQRSNLSAAFNNLVTIVPTFLNSSVSAHRIRELVELPKEVHITESSVLDAYAADGFSISLRDVDFSYVKEERVITDSSFEAKPGEIVALVGPSGEGKTTLIRLFLGLIHPQSGQAVMSAAGGMEVVLNAETRHLFAYVPQGNMLLSGTIRDNLTFINQNATQSEIDEAVRISCADEFINELPEGLETVIGEKGMGLSEGQVQRLAIARSMLSDSPILLLDEATSALDEKTEKKFLTNLKELKDVTCIIVSHKRAALEICNKYVRIENSKIISEENDYVN